MFSHSYNGTNIFIRWKMKCTIQLGFASLNGTFHLSPHENICTIALINIHYLYTVGTNYPAESCGKENINEGWCLFTMCPRTTLNWRHTCSIHMQYSAGFFSVINFGNPFHAPPIGKKNKNEGWCTHWVKAECTHWVIPCVIHKPLLENLP